MTRYQREIRKYEGREPSFKLDGATKYYGQVFNGKANGKGTLITANGSIDVGTWINGKLNGNGIHFDRDGSYYSGKFVNGAYHGKGIVRTANGKVIQRGVFNNGQFVKKTSGTGQVLTILSLVFVIALVWSVSIGNSNRNKQSVAPGGSVPAQSESTTQDTAVDVIFDVTRFIGCNTENLRSIYGEPQVLQVVDNIAYSTLPIPGEWWGYDNIEQFSPLLFLVVDEQIISMTAMLSKSEAYNRGEYLLARLGIVNSNAKDKSNDSTKNTFELSDVGIYQLTVDDIDTVNDKFSIVAVDYLARQTVESEYFVKYPYVCPIELQSFTFDKTWKKVTLKFQNNSDSECEAFTYKLIAWDAYGNSLTSIYGIGSNVSFTHNGNISAGKTGKSAFYSDMYWSGSVNKIGVVVTQFKMKNAETIIIPLFAQGGSSCVLE